jgi:hypothetical protein
LVSRSLAGLVQIVIYYNIVIPYRKGFTAGTDAGLPARLAGLLLYFKQGVQGVTEVRQNG